LTAFSVFDRLILILLYISLNVAEVSLSEPGHLAPYGLTSHTNGMVHFLDAAPTARSITFIAE
jgi:hypothetical protein